MSGGNGDRPGPGATREAELVAEILDFCRLRAVPHTDPEADEEHERAMWREISERFGRQWEGGDFIGLLDDHLLTIMRAMFRP